MRIAVAGATGVAGRAVVAAAGARDHEVVPLARSLGVDVCTGDGLAAHLDGVQAIVDVTSVATQSAQAARKFFAGTSRTLLAAERAARVAHHVTLSIVGIDGSGSGYYQGKVEQERLLAEQDPDVGVVPWSVLRATQFHEFAEQALHFARVGPLSLVPRMLSQPIAASEVGAALVDLVEAGPAGRVADLAGPEVLAMHRLARRVNAARGLGRWVVPIPAPGAAGREMRSGALLPKTPGPRGRVTFEEWLSAKMILPD